MNSNLINRKAKLIENFENRNHYPYRLNKVVNGKTLG